MKVSVVIPAFDRIRSLRAVLQSCMQASDGLEVEVVVVDDKSPYGMDINELAREFSAVYVRNESKHNERQPALCRNLGFEGSSGKIIVFNDADVLLHPKALDTHVRYHAAHTNVVVDAQVWSIPKGEEVLETLKHFARVEIRRRGRQVIQDPEIRWSRLHWGVLPFGTLHPSDNWWGFLSAQCSFKRADFVRVGRWDDAYSGWGVEDNDIGYRIFKNGLRIIYAADVRCFHIDHPITREEYRTKCETALRNLKYMCQKYPELLHDKKVLTRLHQLESVVAGDLVDIPRQETAGGGAIIGSDSHNP